MRPGRSESAQEQDLRRWEFGELKTGACVWPRETPLELTSMTSMTLNHLKRDGRHTVGDVLARTFDQLDEIRNFGMAAMADLCRALASTEQAGDDGEVSRVMYRLQRAVELIEEYEEFLPEGLKRRLQVVVGSESAKS